jgi:glycosyltransferase 2 family protein
MTDQQPNPLKKIKTYQIIYPTIIGFSVVGYMLYHNYKPGAFSLVDITYWSVFWLFIAFLMMFCRDLGYIIRIRVLTNNQLTWLQAFRVIMLWEFTSAITPSAVGGTSVAVLYVTKEGIGVGRSTSVVLTTSFLDELYFVLMFPLLLLFLNGAGLFSIGGGFHWSNPFVITAVVGYSLKLAYIFLVGYGLFINPRGLKWLLMFVFRLPFLRRWRQGANTAGNEIITTAKELKSKKPVFWFKAFGATFFSWTARYWVVNAMFLAFFAVNNHFLLFARQLVMWIIMLVSPTPGGSGFSEYVFTQYLGDFLPYAEIAVLLALLWRLITYYPYLIIGVIILPRWLKRSFIKNK